MNGILHRRAAAAIPALALLAACGVNAPSTESPPPAAARVYPEKMVNHWKSFADWDDATIAEAAEAEMMIVPMDQCFSPLSTRVLEGIRSINPDFRVVGHQPLMAVVTLYPDTAYLRTNLPYQLDYYNAVRGDWAWSTAGDTVFIWPHTVFLNPIKNGTTNRALIDTLIDLLARYEERNGSPVDGILHDYFMYAPYLNPDVADDMEGEIDFDGDGIGYYDDPDEQSLFMQFQLEYADAIRERFGSDFIQIGNGRPPEEMPELASLLNGVYYELYPNFPWCKTDRDGLLRLLENQTPGYLALARGRTWSVCTNQRGQLYGNNLFCLLSSLLAGCMYTDLQGDNLFTGWTLDVDPGVPLGDVTIEGSIDSVLTVRRAYSAGEVRMSFIETGRREEYVLEAAGVAPR